MKPILILSMLILAACSPVRWAYRPSPEDTALTTMDRSHIAEHGWINQYDDWRAGTWDYSWTERLQFMKAPVTVFSVTPVSHGIFREKWRNQFLVVKDGNGTLIQVGEVALDVKVGDVLKAVKP